MMKTTTIKRGDIWTVKTEHGVKKCMIISNDIGNTFSPVVSVAKMMEGKKRKPTQMQVNEQEFVRFEQQATYSKERLVEKVGEYDGRIELYLQAVTKSFTSTNRGIQHLTPRNPNRPIVKQWEAYFIDLGEGVGSEQAGLRLVFVISNDILNQSGDITVVPATSQVKKRIPTHVYVPSSIGIKEDSTLLLEQTLTVSIEKFRGQWVEAVLPDEYKQAVLDKHVLATAYDFKEVERELANKRLLKNA